ncbi:MAG: hypothetical protein NVS4B3_23870 [Gemmatimonadaceae bacterium]
MKAFVHYPAGTYPGQATALADDTHFNNYGAYELARMVVEGIRKEIPQLAVQLLPATPSFDPAHPDSVELFTLPPSPFAALSKPAGS